MSMFVFEASAGGVAGACARALDAAPDNSNTATTSALARDEFPNVLIVRLLDDDRRRHGLDRRVE
jgi:hypothetical protein